MWGSPCFVCNPPFHFSVFAEAQVELRVCCYHIIQINRILARSFFYDLRSENAKIHSLNRRLMKQPEHIEAGDEKEKSMRGESRAEEESVLDIPGALSELNGPVY
jgi:hypothetical protein